MAMCSLGNIYSPNYESGPEPESCERDIYEILDQLANIQ